METIAVRVPCALRPIFDAWSAPCDPAACAAPPQAAADLYGLLAAASFDALLSREALARVYADALQNMVFGQFAELRREGTQVFPWIAQVVASDPLLSAQLL